MRHVEVTGEFLAGNGNHHVLHQGVQKLVEFPVHQRSATTSACLVTKLAVARAAAGIVAWEVMSPVPRSSRSMARKESWSRLKSIESISAIFPSSQRRGGATA